MTDGLLNLRNLPTTEKENCYMPVVERFVYLIYQPAATFKKVDKCRQYPFTKQGKQLEGFCQMRAALKQHTLRAVYKGGYVWTLVLSAVQNLRNLET